MRARKEDQEQALLGHRALENIIEEAEKEAEREGEEQTNQYTPYVILNHVAAFNQSIEEVLRLPVLEWS
jgi:hypothetical protein